MCAPQCNSLLQALQTFTYLLASASTTYLVYMYLGKWCRLTPLSVSHMILNHESPPSQIISTAQQLNSSTGKSVEGLYDVEQTILVQIFLS